MKLKNRLLFIFILLFFTYPAFSDSVSDAKKAKIKNDLIQAQQLFSTQKTQKTQLNQEIREFDTQIATILTYLEENEQQRVEISQNIILLDKEIRILKKQQHQQTELLAQQLEAIFKIGKTGVLDLIFNPQKSSEQARIIQYYHYLTQAREQSIAELKETNLALDEKKSALNAQKEKQIQLIATQNQEKQALETHKTEREQKRALLEKAILQNQSHIAQLKKEEQALYKQIQMAELQNKKVKEAEEKKALQLKKKEKATLTPAENQLIARVQGLGKPNKSFGFPVNGRLQHQFGQRINEQLAFKGLVIQAKEGNPVKAIEDGKVILANWLEGYGFIVVLDHGQGDMSLYGYNQRLAVKVGDNVTKNSTIAYVGNTGGQKEPALYFEIRRNGKAQNPLPFLQKS